MKLNFWQILGVILLVIGVAIWIYERRKPAPGPNVPTTQNINTAPVVQPTR
jgi:hypothetical protein